MKKLRLLLVAIACFSCIAIHAHDFEVDGIYYNIVDAANKGVAVTYAGDYSGYYNEYSGNVVIPEAVTYGGTTYSVISIGSEAFYECDGLASVTIPNSVTSIGEGAFWSCSGLISVTIPNSVASIENCAFIYCSGLTSVTIPNSVTSIGNYVFAGCGSLTSIVVDQGNAIYDSRDNSNAIIEISTSKLIAGCKYTRIPGSVTSIGEGAFYGCSGLASVTIPGSVTNIENCAFTGCAGLTSVTIPGSVTSIGNDVFSGCSTLTSIVVDRGNSNYDSRDNCNAIIETSTNKLIVGCKNTSISNTVTSIGNDAGIKCYGLTSIEIPESVTSIGNSAFEYCYGLISIEIPESVTSIGDFAFYQCHGLKSIEIPESVTSIGNNAFYQCRGLTSMEIPNSVTSIGDFAFYDCDKVETLYIGSAIETIGDNAFNECTQLIEIKVASKIARTASENIFHLDTYNNAILYVPSGRKWAYEKVVPWDNFYIEEFDFAGIDNVEADEDVNAPVEYYNLQGIRVENPQNGIFIRRQGNKVEKVLLK